MTYFLILDLSSPYLSKGNLERLLVFPTEGKVKGNQLAKAVSLA